MKKNFALLISLFCIHYAQTQHLEEIHTVYSLEMLHRGIDTFDEKTLIIFDRDDTLIQGVDCINDEYRVEFVDHWCNIYDTNKTSDKTYRKKLLQNIKNNHPCLVNKDAPALIKKLQKRNVKVIMCTGGCHGKNSVGLNVEEVGIEILHSFGIDLSNTFAQCSGYIFKDVQKNGHSPMFKHGALLCNTCDKGDALLALLNKANHRPTRIIFVDDKIYYQKEIQRAAHNIGASFLGLHYREAETLPAPNLTKQCYRMPYLLERDLK